MYAGIGKVDYTNIWKELSLINEILEGLDIYDQVCETELYQSLLNLLLKQRKESYTRSLCVILTQLLKS